MNSGEGLGVNIEPGNGAEANPLLYVLHGLSCCCLYTPIFPNTKPEHWCGGQRRKRQDSGLYWGNNTTH